MSPRGCACVRGRVARGSVAAYTPPPLLPSCPPPLYPPCVWDILLFPPPTLSPFPISLFPTQFFTVVCLAMKKFSFYLAAKHEFCLVVLLLSLHLFPSSSSTSGSVSLLGHKRQPPLHHHSFLLLPPSLHPPLAVIGCLLLGSFPLPRVSAGEGI